MNKPLSGIKVVELSTFVAAPVTARLLADLGAEVIKIEAPAGDNWRTKGISFNPERFSQDENPIFALYNTGKKLISLNLKTPKGMEALQRLLTEADVFVTNLRPKALTRLGLTYEDLRQTYPQLIYAMVMGYGAQGPDAEKPAFDTTAFWSRSGFLRDLVSAEETTVPINPPAGVGDTVTAYLLLAEITTALYNRNRTGKGDFVRSTLYHNGIFCMGTMAIAAQRPFGINYPIKRSEHGTPDGSYLCADGEWVFAATTDPVKTVAALHRVIGRPDLTDEPRFSVAERGKHLDEYYGILRDVFRTKPADEWLRLAAEEDVPLIRMGHFSDISEDPQAWANGFVERVAFPSGNVDVMPSSPIEMDSVPPTLTAPARGVGCDTKKVLNVLGYTEDEIQQMLDSGAAVAE